MSKQWPPSLTLDHRIKLDDLNCNLLIDQHGATWIHCPGRGPDVPTLKALYLPLKYRPPVICNFQQRYSDVPVRNQMQKLQENYCWLSMREDIAKHSATCNNAKFFRRLKGHLRSPMPTFISTFTGHSSPKAKTNLWLPSPTKPQKLPSSRLSNPNQLTHWPTPSSLIGSAAWPFLKSSP